MLLNIKLMRILETQKIDKKILIAVDDILNNMPILTEDNEMFIFDNYISFLSN